MRGISSVPVRDEEGKKKERSAFNRHLLTNGYNQGPARDVQGLHNRSFSSLKHVTAYQERYIACFQKMHMCTQASTASWGRGMNVGARLPELLCAEQGQTGTKV